MMNAAFILQEQAFADIYGDECLRLLAPHATLVAPPVTAARLAAEPPDWLAQVDVVFSGWGGPRFDACLLAKMPRLRAVFYGAGSLRPIVSDALWARSIVVCNAAAMNAQPVIEFTLGAIFLSFKRVWHQDRAVRVRRGFQPLLGEPCATGFGATVGLTSLGLIGRGVAERLRAADVEVLAFDPTLSAEAAAKLGVRSVSLEELFARADIVSLHTPLLPETMGMVDAALLGRLKPGATLINTARGGLIVERDLIEVLKVRPDVQAILDVTDPEPPAPESPLFDLPNVFLTPHIAGSIGRECRRMGQAMIEEYLRFARGEPLRFAVDARQFELTA